MIDRARLLKQCLFLWMLPPSSLEDITDDGEFTDVIVAHGWAHGSPINKWVIHGVYETLRMVNAKFQKLVPIIAQDEVGDHFTSSANSYSLFSVKTLGAYDVPGYVDTRDTAFVQRHICDDNGWNKVRAWLVTWPAHLVRAALVTKGVGFKVCIPDIYPANPFARNLFHPENKPWGKSKLEVMKRDILVRLMYLATNRITQPLDLDHPVYR